MEEKRVILTRKGITVSRVESDVAKHLKDGWKIAPLPDDKKDSGKGEKDSGKGKK